MEHLVEPAVPGDFLAIAALDRIAWADPFIADGEHVWRIWCEYAHLLVARKPGAGNDRTIAGALVMFTTHDQRLFLHKIMVAPEARGGGVGTALLQRALFQARRPVLLTVDPANDHAIKLYRKHGFVIHQKIEGYYRPHEHRYVMIHMPAISA